MGANRFVNVLNRHGVTFKLARRNGAAVQDQARNIQPRQRHDSSRNRFVAAHENDQRVKQIAAGDQLNGIRDDFTAHQRSAHTLGAHGDAVGNGNGVELQWSSARGANALLDVFRQFAKVIVAGTDFDPGVGDADEWFLEIVII